MSPGGGCPPEPLTEIPTGCSLTQYAQANGLTVAGVYTDEGITARKKYRSRAAFMRMLEDVQAGVRAMLDNEQYIGRAHGQDDFCPPLISPERFQQVQELLSQRAQRNLARSDRVYLFTGLARCAECGGSLSAHVAGQKYTYYPTAARNTKSSTCARTKKNQRAGSGTMAAGQPDRQL